MEKVISTKEKILITSLKLFSEKGFDGVSMREIAAAVGIKGTVSSSGRRVKADGGKAAAEIVEYKIREDGGYDY